METIGGILLILSLLGNWYQSERIDHHKQKAEHFQEIAQQNYRDAKEAKEVNERLEKNIERLQATNNACDEKLNTALDRINTFGEVNRIKDDAIERLRIELERAAVPDVSDWLDCRLPDGVDVEAFNGSD